MLARTHPGVVFFVGAVPALGDDVWVGVTLLKVRARARVCVSVVPPRTGRVGTDGMIRWRASAQPHSGVTALVDIGAVPDGAEQDLRDVVSERGARRIPRRGLARTRNG